jgi:sigma-B regulation protein RsbU (phosphoserine phosphatase)
MESFEVSMLDTDDVACRIGDLQKVIEAHQKRAHQHLQLAAKVHRSLLPLPVQTDRIDVDVRYLPVEQVGGDYCQVRFPSDDVYYITMCDVTGHGIGAALLATRVSSEVRHSVLSGKPPAQVLDALNRFVCDNFGDAGLFLTFLAVRIDVANREITWSGAGHPSGILLRPDGTTAWLASQNLMIGVQPECLGTEPEHRVHLAAGDRVLLYTDGLTEVFDSSGSELGESGLAAIAVSERSDDLFGMTDSILERIHAFQHGPATDDRTLILIGLK